LIYGVAGASPKFIGLVVNVIEAKSLQASM
jgi:hypothetical protein